MNRYLFLLLISHKTCKGLACEVFYHPNPTPPLKKEKMFDVYFAFHMKLRQFHFFWKGVARAYVATLYYALALRYKRHLSQFGTETSHFC